VGLIFELYLKLCFLRNMQCNIVDDTILLLYNSAEDELAFVTSNFQFQN
jgi:hypothetical protein